MCTIERTMTNTHSNKQRLRQRLRYLWTFELFDSVFLPAVMVFCARTLERPVGFFAIYSAGLVTWMLWQGAAYWMLKLRALRTDSTIGANHLRCFKLLKTLNWGLIGVMPVLLVGKALLGNPFRSVFDAVAGIGFYSLAVLEQINYYHYQLMYDYPPDWRYLLSHKTLKRSSLSRALANSEASWERRSRVGERGTDAESSVS